MKIAVIDLYKGIPNEGMRGIIQILDSISIPISYDIFDLRVSHEIPGLDYDCYISGGGPGDPREGEGIWEEKWFGLIESITSHNNKNSGKDKKFVFLICHSFQLMCLWIGLGKISKRHSLSFGIFPFYPTDDGRKDPLFSALPDPFYAVDSRSFQVIVEDSDLQNLHNNIEILAFEKKRPHVSFLPAIMAVRFSPEIVGTQFHPEADLEGMERYFNNPATTDQIIAEYGKEKLENMKLSLKDPEHIASTNKILLPGFLLQAYKFLF